jgi:hypothetical protein
MEHELSSTDVLEMMDIDMPTPAHVVFDLSSTAAHHGSPATHSASDALSPQSPTYSLVASTSHAPLLPQQPSSTNTSAISARNANMPRQPLNTYSTRPDQVEETDMSNDDAPRDPQKMIATGFDDSGAAGII